MATPKHKKMYKGSPRIEADETGKKVIKKGPTEAEKESSEVNAGIDGIPMTESGPMYDRHMKEMMDMNDRHIAERKDIAKRHLKEMGGASPKEEKE